jgi:fibronectin-binding autotransporter adhesin
MRTPFLGVKNELRTVKLFQNFVFTTALIAACMCPALAFGQTNSKWNGGTGNWNAGGDWTPNGVPNNSGGNTYNVTIDSGGTDTVNLNLNATISSLVLGGATGTSTLQNLSGTAETLSILGGLTLNSGGTISGITVTAGGSGTVDGNIINGSNVTVQGKSTLDGIISGGSTLTIGASATGEADLEGGSELVISGNLNGGVSMDQSGTGNNALNVKGTCTCGLDLGPSNTTNFSINSVSIGKLIGSITTGGDAFNISIGTWTNNGQTTLGMADSDSSETSVGTFTNNGSVTVGGMSADALIVNSLINKGNITLFPNDNDSQSLAVVGDDNSGTITLIDGASATLGSLTGGGVVNVMADGSAVWIKNNVNNTIEGSGSIGGGFDGPTPFNNEGVVNGSFNIIATTFSNKGLVSGDNTIQTTGGTVNTGTLEATDGGSLVLDGNTFKNAGGTITATGTGSVVLLENGATVIGGTLSETGGGLVETPSGQTATLNGVTILGSYEMADNSMTTLSGKITNNGTISLASAGSPTIAMIPSGGATLAGTGTLTLGTGGPNSIEGSTGKEFFTNSSTIQGAGAITSVGLINNGTILANAGTLAIGPTVQGYAFTNNGSLIVDSGSTVNITGPVKLSFQTTGTVTVSSGATFSVGGSSAFTQTKGTTTVDGNLSAANGIFISGGILDGNGGTLTGNLSLAGATLSLGDGANKVGELTVSGAYSQASTSFLDIDLDGAKSGTFDVLNINGSASLHGTLNVDALSGFTPTVGEQFDILNYSSETGSFSTVLCTFSNGDTCSIAYNSTGGVLTIDAPATPAQSTVSASPAKRISRGLLAGIPASMHEPSAILSRVTCFAGRLLETSCGSGSVASAASSGELHARSVGASSGTVHNNVMVATRSLSASRNGASHESSASATAMARLYACAYLPLSVAHTMGCY